MRVYGKLRNALTEKLKRNGFIPLIMVLLFIAAVFIVDFLFFDGTRFVDVSWHPFWIIIIAVSMCYGLEYGVVTSFVCIFALYVGNFPDVRADELIREYWLRLAVNPVAWIISAFVIGFFRKRELAILKIMKGKLEASERKTEEIARQYNKIVGVNNQLEEKLASQSQTIFTVYDAIKNIEADKVSTIVDGCASLLKMVLNADRFSLFLLNNDELKSMYSYGWDCDENYVSEYTAMSHLYTEIVQNGRTLSVLNGCEEFLDGALFACPVAVKGKVYGMIRIDKIAFSSLTAQNIAAVKVIAEWTASSLKNADNYNFAKSQSLIDPEMNIMSSTFYEKELNFVANLAERCSFHLSVITVEVDDIKISVSEHKKLSEVISEAVCSYLRRTDLVFIAPMHNVAYALMLPGTDQKGTKVVADKIMMYLKEKTQYSDRIKCSVQNIYSPKEEIK